MIFALPVFFLKEGTIPPDAFSYMNIAHSLSVGQGYFVPLENPAIHISYGRGPLFSVLFAFSFRLFGFSIPAALLVTKTAHFCSVILLYLLAKKLYGIKTGLAVAALVATSSYLVGFPAHLLIDQTQALFVLVSLYLLIVALDSVSVVFAIFSGIALGLSFLTKEIAVLFLPLPVYLILSISRWRRWENLFCWIGFTLGFSLLPGLWWIYFYVVTGEIFLLSTRARLFDYLFRSGLVWVIVAACAGGVILWLSYQIYRRHRQSPWMRSIKLFLPSIVTWSFWIGCTVLFSIFLGQIGVKFDSLAQMPQRLAGFEYWWQLRVLREQPLLDYTYLLPAILIVILGYLFKKEIGDKVLVWSFLVCVPQILTLSIEEQYVQAGRYGMWLFWLSYLVLGRAIIVLISLFDQLVPWFKRRAWRPTNLAFMLFLSYAMWTSWAIPETYNYDRYSSPANWNIENVLELSRWVSQHVSDEANLASSTFYHLSLDFYTGGEYTIYRWSNRPRERSERKWPYSYVCYLVVDQDRQLSFVDFFNEKLVLNPIYIGTSHLSVVNPRESSFRMYYSSISRQSLVDFLQDLEIDYLIFTEGPLHRYLVHVNLDYFADHPAFQQVFSTHWREGSSHYTIRVLKVDRSRLNDVNYPVTVTSKAWTTLLEDAKLVMGKDVELYTLIQALGTEPIVLRPISPDNFVFYQEIADAYLEHGDFERAAFQYHLALSEVPDRAGDLAQLANQFLEGYPDNAGSWLLKGDVHYVGGNLSLAQEAYQQAVAASQGSTHTYAAAHQGLGKVYLALGQNHAAIEQFESTLDLSFFGAAETRQQLLIAQANLHQDEGDIDKAIAAYYEAFKDDLTLHSPDSSSVAIDFINQTAQSQRVAGNAVIRPFVFIVDDQIHPVLFAHPPSELSYTVQVPASALLHFAPALSPAVWHPGRGDGVQFDLYLDDGATRHNPFSRYIDPKNVPEQRRWHDYKIDLAPWAGQTVTLTFSTGCGPNDDCDYDWAGWGEPRIVQPVYYDFLAHYTATITTTQQFGQVYTTTQTIDYETRLLLFQHPPSRAAYTVTLPQQSTLAFGLGMAPEVWDAEKGDGVDYRIYVQRPNEPYKLYQVYGRYLDPKHNPDDRRWVDARVDLSRFGGETVQIIFEATPGPAGDANYDWGGWSWPVLIDETLPQ